MCKPMTRFSRLIGVACLVTIVLPLAFGPMLAQDVASSLKKQLEDPDGKARVNALIAAGEAGANSRPLVGQIVMLLESDKEPSVRGAAAKTLAVIFLADAKNPPEGAAIRALAKAMGNDGDTLVRWASCEAFALIGPEAYEAAPALLEAMKNKDDGRMRQIAGRSLVYVAGPKCEQLSPKLVEMFKKGIDDESSEFNTLVILGRIGANEDAVVPLLMEVLREKEPKRARLRSAAAAGLGAMGSKSEKAVPLLVECLEESARLQKDDPRNIWNSSTHALRNMGAAAKAALPALGKIAEDATLDERLRRKARTVMRAIEDSAR